MGIWTMGEWAIGLLGSLKAKNAPSTVWAIRLVETDSIHVIVDVVCLSVLLNILIDNYIVKCS